MHTIVIRARRLPREPLGRAVAATRRSSRRSAGPTRTCTTTAALTTMLPWQIAQVEEARREMGEDWWSYGFEPNRHVLETFLRYHHEQGLSKRRLRARGAVRAGDARGVQDLTRPRWRWWRASCRGRRARHTPAYAARHTLARERNRCRRPTPSASRTSLAAKHQRTKPSPSGPNATPGAMPRPGLGDEPLAEREAVGHAPDAKERVHRAGCGDRVDPRHRPQVRVEEIARAPKALDGMGDHVVALRDGGDAGALHEGGRARRVVLDELGEIGYDGRRRHEPAQPPARHQPRLRERVGADDAIVGLGEIEKRWGGRLRRAAPIVEPLVRIVGDDPDPVATAMGEDRALIARIDGPAGRIVRRVDVDGAGRRRERRQQAIEIERPAGRAERERRRTRPSRRGSSGSRRGSATAASRRRPGHPGSPAAAWSSISADIPELVTAMRSPIGRPAQPRHVAGDRVAQFRPCRGCACRTSRPRSSESIAACRMNAGVTSSGSPNQNARTSSRPMPALATSRIFDARRRSTTSRAEGGKWVKIDGFGRRASIIGDARVAVHLGVV